MERPTSTRSLDDEVQLTKLEGIFIVGIIGCLLFATWELAHLMADVWFADWVNADRFTRQRIIYYGIASIASLAAVGVTTRFAFDVGRFGKTVHRAFLWYGTLLLIGTIAFFVFDCLPEVVAGLAGAGVFIAAIYVLQQQYFTRERVVARRLQKGECYSCGHDLRDEAIYCSSCGAEVGHRCPNCEAFAGLMDEYCAQCGQTLEPKSL